MSSTGGATWDSSKENPANRAKIAPSLFSQIFSGIEKFIEDITNPLPNQDRGGAVPATGADVLVINAQNTPPAATNGQPENGEMRGQVNEPQFRFLSVLTTPTLSATEPKGKAQHPFAGGTDKHVPGTKGLPFDSKAILGGKIPTGKVPRGNFLREGPNGRRILQTAQNSIDPSGFSTGGAGGGSGGSGGSGGGGRAGGGFSVSTRIAKTN